MSAHRTPLQPIAVTGPLRDRPSAAQYLSVSIRTLAALVAAGVIPVVRVSARRVAFCQADLDAYITQRRR